MGLTIENKPLATIRGFRGLHMRGGYDSCPPDHLTACMNCTFPGPDQITIREPVTVSSTVIGRSIISYFVAEVDGGARLLVLDASGDLYDATAATHLIAFGAGVDDIACLNIFGRTYISPKVKGIPASSFVYMYDGTTFRIAAGAGPITTLTLAQVNPGNVSIGTHGVSVSFLSPTGFLTNPNPTVASINSTGANDIEISGIPTYSGSSDSANWKRVILVTQANQTAFFFLPGGTINDNITTTLSINFFDSSLISSADYLFNLYSGIPAGSSLKFYRGRMVVVGNTSAPDDLLVSRLSDPESFDKVAGVVHFPVNKGINTCNTGVVILDVLYIMKPNGTYSTQDNGGDPSTWSVSMIDSALGAWDNGVSRFASSASSEDVFDSSFIITRRGLMLFQAGTYSPIPFSRKIETLWNTLDPNGFYKLQIAQDVWLKRVYIAVTLNNPIGNLTSPPTYNSAGKMYVILMMDYQEGLNPDAVKWSTWTSATVDASNLGITKMLFENFTLSYSAGTVPIYQLSFCTGDVNIYKIIILNPQLSPVYTKLYIADVGGLPINQYIVTSPNLVQSDGVFTYTMLNLSVYGSGRLQLMLLNRRGDISGPLFSTTIAANIAAGSQTVTPASMAGIVVGTAVLVNNSDGSNAEITFVSAVTNTTFTAFWGTSKTGPGIQVLFGNAILRPFFLNSYTNSYDLQRLINFTYEGMQVIIWGGLEVIGGNNSFFQLVKLDVYGNRMWKMRPALLESA